MRQLKVRRFESLSSQRFSQLFIIALLTGARPAGRAAHLAAAQRRCAPIRGRPARCPRPCELAPAPSMWPLGLQ
jgi:hypothetical protein